MLFLKRRVGHDSTALRVASAPVPAVVGIATTGRGARESARPRPTPSSRSRTACSGGSSSAASAATAASALAKSIVEPPPTATITASCLPARGSAARASATCATVGSPEVTATTRTSSPESAIAASTAVRPPLATAARPPATSQHDRPRLPATAPASATRPGPKRMRGGHTKS